MSLSPCASPAASRDDPAAPDFVIRCAGVQWRVHRCLLAARSDYFARLLCGADGCGGGGGGGRGAGVSAQFAEVTSGCVELSAVDAWASREGIEALLRYLYTAYVQPHRACAQRADECASYVLLLLLQCARRQ
jgi:hypothetical protein